MHTVPYAKLPRLALLATLIGSAAHAQLLLSGTTTGLFTDVAGPNDEVYDAADGSWAYIKSGIPEHSSDLQTEIDFTEKSFTNAGPGLVATNIFTITNGRTLLGSTATAAHFNLSLHLTGPETTSTFLTTVPFSIDNTPNGPGSVDDVYGIQSTPIAPFIVDGTKVQFTFTAPKSISIHENSSAGVGDLFVTFTPVPEPSTYGWMAVALLGGVAGVRVLRRRRVAGALI